MENVLNRQTAEEAAVFLVGSQEAVLLSVWTSSRPGLRLRRVVPLPAITGRERNFEGSLPPSQPQVGGILGWHWHSWSSCGAEDWTVEVLCFGYLVSFHYLPPVLREPIEFISYALGFAEALKEEGDKMLQKGAL